MQKLIIWTQRVFLYACISFVLALGSDALAGTRVTALIGNNKTDAGGLTAHATLNDEDTLETAADGGAALLLDDDAVMEVCGDSRMRLRRKDGDPNGARIVEIKKGTVRMVVEPRMRGERIEIHTPAAIATILGTVVLIEVDALGVTTITSEVNKVLVESASDNVAGKTLVDGGQQIVIQPGQAPPAQARRLTKRERDRVGGCLMDFADLSLSLDRLVQANQKVEESANNDIIEQTPPVGAGGGGNIIIEEGDDPQDIIESTDDPGNIELGLMLPPCGGIPGEHCGGRGPPLPQ